jgi:hypothetical protein
MPRLLRLRLVSVGHPQARMEDLTLDFRDPNGGATDSTLWLRNGGGKSSILNLFFAIVRPHRGEFLGGKAEAKQRSLDDYVFPGDRSVTVAEWALDAGGESPAPLDQRFLTGVFYERREGSGDLRRLFFATRVSDEVPDSTLPGLPLFSRGPEGPTRRTLTAFREAWLRLRDSHPDLGVSETHNQGEWQAILDGARVDPELFSYQVRMNQREGGADELFRFAEAEDFIDFLLALALDPALGDRVGKNIFAWRRELLDRKERLIPEDRLLSGLLDRLAPLQAVRDKRDGLRSDLANIRGDLTSLDRLGKARSVELRGQCEADMAESGRLSASAIQFQSEARRLRAEAATLRRSAVRTRLARLESDQAQAQLDWKEAKRFERLWSAAVPLCRALQFERRAREQHRVIEEREAEHAPLRLQLGEAASRLSASLLWRAGQLRAKANETRDLEITKRDEAVRYRKEAAVASAARATAESDARALSARLADSERARARLQSLGHLASDEDPQEAVSRHTLRERDLEEAIGTARQDLVRLDAGLEALDNALLTANAVLASSQSERQLLDERLGTGERERSAIEASSVLRTALELEAVDADRLGPEALAILEQRAKAEQHATVEAHLAQADEARAALHIEETGLLPPSREVQRLVELLRNRLGQAWSGWAWIAENVPKDSAVGAVRSSPYIAQGIVVRPGDVERACDLIRASDALPDGPVVIAGSDALGSPTPLSGTVVGPREVAWFDRSAAKERLVGLHLALDEHRRHIADSETQHRELTRAREALQVFRDRYPCGWFESTQGSLRAARRGEGEARNRIEDLTTQRREQTERRRAMEGRIGTLVQERDLARSALSALSTFVEEHVLHASAWNEKLTTARSLASSAAEDVERWNGLADGVDEAAKALAVDAQKQGEDARAIEEEQRHLVYVDGATEPEQGPLDSLRDRYSLLKAQYEEKVGADHFLSLAKENEQRALQERRTLAGLLSDDITEDLVRELLEPLADVDSVERHRQEAVDGVGPLFARVGNLGGRIEEARRALDRAQEACLAADAPAALPDEPLHPDLADAEATTRERNSDKATHSASAARAASEEAHVRYEKGLERARRLDSSRERVEGLRNAYGDLLAEAASGEPQQTVATLEDSMFSDLVESMSGRLQAGRGTWRDLNAEGRRLSQGVRTWATEDEFAQVSTPWVRALQQHDDAQLEQECGRLAAQLELRQRILREHIESIERHRTLLVDEVQAVADEGLKLLRQATNLSTLPDHIPGIGGAQFLRITTQEPSDPGERRARLAGLVDELVDGEKDMGGVSLVQAAVKRLARPVQVRVLHPDPALDRRTVSIPEMARSSGGEQLTGAILLYCTLARVRGRARGHSRRTSSVLLLDNPIGRASRVRFLELQRDVARAMGVQLIYTTGVNDHEALRALPNVIRLRNERVDRNSGKRLIERGDSEIEAARIGRREDETPAHPSGD